MERSEWRRELVEKIMALYVISATAMHIKREDTKLLVRHGDADAIECDREY
jgi:hypothetical protein